MTKLASISKVEFGRFRERLPAAYGYPVGCRLRVPVPALTTAPLVMTADCDDILQPDYIEVVVGKYCSDASPLPWWHRHWRPPILHKVWLLADSLRVEDRPGRGWHFDTQTPLVFPEGVDPR